MAITTDALRSLRRAYCASCPALCQRLLTVVIFQPAARRTAPAFLEQERRAHHFIPLSATHTADSPRPCPTNPVDKSRRLRCTARIGPPCSAAGYARNNARTMIAFRKIQSCHGRRWPPPDTPNSSAPCQAARRTAGPRQAGRDRLPGCRRFSRFFRAIYRVSRSAFRYTCAVSRSACLSPSPQQLDT